jgi:hypothetical protein
LSTSLSKPGIPSTHAEGIPRHLLASSVLHPAEEVLELVDGRAVPVTEVAVTTAVTAAAIDAVVCLIRDSITETMSSYCFGDKREKSDLRGRADRRSDHGRRAGRASHR